MKKREWELEMEARKRAWENEYKQGMDNFKHGMDNLHKFQASIEHSEKQMEAEDED